MMIALSTAKLLASPCAGLLRRFIPAKSFAQPGVIEFVLVQFACGNTCEIYMEKGEHVRSN